MNLVTTAVADASVLTAAGAVATAAISDIRRYQIPNRLPLIVSAAFLVMCTVSEPRFAVGGLAVGAVVLVVGFLLFTRGLVGGGDIKLLTAVSLWCGPALLTSFALVTSVVGVVLALVMLSPARVYMPPAPARLAASGVLRQPMPMGVAIAAGGLWVLVHTATMMRF